MIKATVLAGLLFGVCLARVPPIAPAGGRVGPPLLSEFTRQDDNKLDEKKPRFGPANAAAPAPGAAPAIGPPAAAPAPAPAPPAPAPPAPAPPPPTQAPPPMTFPATTPPPPPPPPPAPVVAAPAVAPAFNFANFFTTRGPIYNCQDVFGECRKESEVCDPLTEKTSDDYCPVDDEYCCVPI